MTGRDLEDLEEKTDNDRRADHDPKGPPRLSLLVLGENAVDSRILPQIGTITIGRGSEATISLADSKVSRIHATLEIQPSGGGMPTLIVRDAKSSNGTSVRGTRLETGGEAMIGLGDLIEVGHTTLVVQRAAGAEPRRRLWAHGYFELRLQEEIERASRSGGRLAVLRVRLRGATQVASVDHRLTAALGAEHLLAVYVPGEYEALLLGATRERAEEMSRAIRDALTPLGAAINIGIACYPADAQSAEQLLAECGARARNERTDTPDSVVVLEDRAMTQLYELAERVAASEINVLILGETGVGKEVLARWIHQRSRRAGQPFLALNCATFAGTLLESELFGHEKGSFTGADQAKRGLFEVAKSGTLFLDEVGEMPTSTQAKLLRVIEERRGRRVGGLEGFDIDVRFLAATNRDLSQAIEGKSFRSDLYYRLNGISLLIPPLRQRVGEIEPLAKAFARQALARMGLDAEPSISAEALVQLQHYHWPGNIRELKNIIERAVVLADSGRIEIAHVPLEKFTASFLVEERPSIPRESALFPPPVATAAPSSLKSFPDRSQTLSDHDGVRSSLHSELREVERSRIIAVLDECQGNQTRAAAKLGLSRKALMARLDAYNIPRPRKGKPAE